MIRYYVMYYGRYFRSRLRWSTQRYCRREEEAEEEKSRMLSKEWNFVISTNEKRCRVRCRVSTWQTQSRNTNRVFRAEGRLIEPVTTTHENVKCLLAGKLKNSVESKKRSIAVTRDERSLRRIEADIQNRTRRFRSDKMNGVIAGSFVKCCVRRELLALFNIPTDIGDRLYLASNVDSSLT